MTIKIDDDRFSSPDTHHVAVRITKTAWLVTWLRDDHRLTRNQAITAMMIASTVGSTTGVWDLAPGELTFVTRIAKDPVFGHLNSWAGELGLDGKQAIAMVLQPRKWDPARFGVSQPAAGTVGTAVLESTASPAALAEARRLASLTDEQLIAEAIDADLGE